MQPPLRKSGYIVPSSIIPDRIFLSPEFREAWGAMPTPGDPTKSLLFIDWDNPNAEREFEERTDVEILPLGRPWEPLPPEVAPLLASFNPDSELAQTAARMATPDALPATDLPTVHQALRDALGMRTYR